ncbi:MAG: PAS domain-containing protein, partial [Thermoanaerobaculia bacterium]|nr:PAS domain-containing protein [Thermoanaerobaculia bacterium]
MHTLLRRQLRRLLDEERLADPGIAALVAAVDQAYEQSDVDRAMLERALDLSSDELLQANARLRRDQVDLEARVAARTGELEAAHRSLAAEMEERLHAQEALTREEAKIRIFVEQLPAITYIALPGVDGRWLFVSSRVESLLGFTVEEWLADAGLFYSRVHPEDRGHVLAESERSRREGDQMSSEYRLIARDGRVIWFRDVAVYLPPGGAEPGRFQGVMLDVTERRALQDQLLHSQKVEAVGQLAGGVAHDFNNLLTAISGYSELVLRKLGGGHPASADVHAILRAAERATKVTGKLLAFSRRSQLDPRNVDVGGLMVGLEALLQRVIGEHIVLHLDLVPEPLVVRVDPTQLEQVIVNLVVNARDAMPD